ncbi:restriction endonuclease subunit S [Chryseobacterium sp. KLBC 52]|uniref:restriction endonuclease subunit S n=1 Tax=Chryseobacterium sp. KLBC 52 TaxID=1862702 RepID=UPI000E0C2031|nr:restriction endonuclease subunit S [Chryseobacterium sp. KLBC 52]
MGTVRLLEVCDFVGGSQPPKSIFVEQPQQGYVRLLQIRDFESDHRAVYIPDKNNLRKVEKYDVLLARYGASVGKVLSGKAGAYNVALMKAVPDETKVSRRFIYYLLKSKQFQNYLKIISESRAAQAGFNKRDLNRFIFNLPSLERQERIAVQLDTIQTIIENRERSIVEYETLKKALFFSFFVANKEREHWSYNELSRYIKKTRYGVAEALNGETGFPTIRMNNLTYEGALNLSELKFIALSDEEFKKYELKDRDILFNRTNSIELVGKTTVWGSLKGFVYAGYLFTIKLDEKKLNPYYLAAYLNSDLGKAILRNKAKQSGNMANFSATLLGKQKILIPPIELQKSYEEEIFNLDKHIDAVKQSHNLLHELFQALLQDIFSSKGNVNENIVFGNLIKRFTSLDIAGNITRSKSLLKLFKDNNFENIADYEHSRQILFELLLSNDIQQKIIDNKISLGVNEIN